MCGSVKNYRTRKWGTFKWWKNGSVRVENVGPKLHKLNFQIITQCCIQYLSYRKWSIYYWRYSCIMLKGAMNDEDRTYTYVLHIEIAASCVEDRSKTRLVAIPAWLAREPHAAHCLINTRNSLGDEIANVNFLRRHRTWTDFLITAKHLR